MKKYLWGVLYGLALTAFTLYLLLDTFVIERVYEVVPEDPPASQTEPADAESGKETGGEPTETEEEEEEDTFFTENGYEDENIRITIETYREKDTTVYVADILLSSPEFLKTAFARNAYGKNVTEKTSVIAEQNGAILAINGDYYGAQEYGYVLRNGHLYRSAGERTRDDLVIGRDGSFRVIRERDTEASELADEAAQIFSFGPPLIVDGELTVWPVSEVALALADNPRTAIGIVDDLHYVFVVADGRTPQSKGMRLYDLGLFLQRIGVKTAYNLDGGGSTTMVFNGEIVNRPTTDGRQIVERSVSDIVYIGY